MTLLREGVRPQVQQLSFDDLHHEARGLESLLPLAATGLAKPIKSGKLLIIRPFNPKDFLTEAEEIIKASLKGGQIGICRGCITRTEAAVRKARAVLAKLWDPEQKNPVRVKVPMADRETLGLHPLSQLLRFFVVEGQEEGLSDYCQTCEPTAQSMHVHLDGRRIYGVEQMQNLIRTIDSRDVTHYPFVVVYNRPLINLLLERL